MRHVKQRLKNDCGIAAAAMATRVSYIRAKKVTPYYFRSAGITAARMKAILGILSGRNWHKFVLHGKLPRLPDFSFKGEAVILIYNPYKKKGLCCHYAFVKDGIYYDPDLPYPVRLKSRRLQQWKHWRVWQIIVKSEQNTRPSLRRRGCSLYVQN